jgi:hypothetical protein
MPDAEVLQLAEFRNRPRPAREAKLAEPEPNAEAAAEGNDDVVDTLTNAAAQAKEDGWAKVLVIFESDEGDVDYCYSYATNGEKLWMVERTKQAIMDET